MDGQEAVEREVDFHSAFLELDGEVRDACEGQAEWQGKIAAGIRAALEFAASRPSAAAALTVEEAAFRAAADGVRHGELIEHFSELLGEVAPAEHRLPDPTNEALVTTIVTVVVVHLRCGTAERLRDAIADLIHLTLLPNAGFTEARRWAQRGA
jgi:hypothetical protein